MTETKEKATQAKTKYIVLQAIEVPQAEGSPTLAWAAFAEVEAVGDLRAVGIATTESGHMGGRFIAIPARSFRVRTIELVPQRTRVS